MKKGVKVVLAIVIVAVLVALGVRAIKHKKAREAKIPPAKSYALIVRTMTPEWRETRLTLPYIATVRNDNDALIASKLAARIERILPSGTSIKKGQRIVWLDAKNLEAKKQEIQAKLSSARASLAAAKASLAAAQAAHERTKKLLAVRGASQERYENEAARIAALKAKIDAAKAQIAALEAAYTEVVQNLSYAVITAPIDGVVAALMAHRGDMAMPGKPLMKIAADQGAYLSVEMPDSIVPRSVIFENKNLSLTPLGTTVRGLVPYRSGPIDASLPSGQRVDVKVVTFDGNAILLPHDALLSVEGKSSVFLYDHGHAVRRPIHIVASGQEGVATDDRSLLGKRLVVAKPDILLHLSAGTPVVTTKD